MKEKFAVRAFAGPETGIACPETTAKTQRGSSHMEGEPIVSMRNYLFLLLQ
jgi:hypothetical protein